eukprot:364869-Chlamydomonas_euryale.AAC.26
MGHSGNPESATTAMHNRPQQVSEIRCTSHPKLATTSIQHQLQQTSEIIQHIHLKPATWHIHLKPATWPSETKQMTHHTFPPFRHSDTVPLVTPGRRTRRPRSHLTATNCTPGHTWPPDTAPPVTALLDVNTQSRMVAVPSFSRYLERGTPWAGLGVGCPGPGRQMRCRKLSASAATKRECQQLMRAPPDSHVCSPTTRTRTRMRCMPDPAPRAAVPPLGFVARKSVADGTHTCGAAAVYCAAAAARHVGSQHTIADDQTAIDEPVVQVGSEGFRVQGLEAL